LNISITISVSQQPSSPYLYRYKNDRTGNTQYTWIGQYEVFWPEVIFNAALKLFGPFSIPTLTFCIMNIQNWLGLVLTTAQRTSSQRLHVSPWTAYPVRVTGL